MELFFKLKMELLKQQNVYLEARIVVNVRFNWLLSTLTAPLTDAKTYERIIKFKRTLKTCYGGG